MSLSVPLSETSWLVAGLFQQKPYRLAPDPWHEFLERFLEPYRNHTPEWRAFFRGAYGPNQQAWVPELRWGLLRQPAKDPGPPVLAHGLLPSEWAPLPPEWAPLPPEWAPLPPEWAPRPEPLAVLKHRPCPYWKNPRPLVVTRLEGEREVLALRDCDGAIQSEALERLSVLARPPGTPRPAVPFPSEPEGEEGEWLPSVRLLHPRLAWAVEQIAQAFPGRAVIIYSGYRKDGHSGHHRTGRALDFAVSGTPNEELFAVCRRLRDVGCGFYPNNRFIHVDVRPYATGRISWVDVSEPGEPSRYTDGYPGVLSQGTAWPGPG